MAENSRGQERSGQPHINERNRTKEDMTKSNSDHQNASATRGGTTDMDNDNLSSSRSSGSRAGSGSGITTKRNVTGSDYDGQISE